MICVFPKIGIPQNGYFFPWKTLFFNGWFGGKTHYFRKHLPTGIIPANVCLSIPIHSLHIPSTFRILFFSNFTKSVDLTAERRRDGWRGPSPFSSWYKKQLGAWCLEEMKTTWKKSSNPMIVQMPCNSHSQPSKSEVSERQLIHCDQFIIPWQTGMCFLVKGQIFSGIKNKPRKTQPTRSQDLFFWDHLRSNGGEHAPDVIMYQVISQSHLHPSKLLWLAVIIRYFSISFIKAFWLTVHVLSGYSYHTIPLIIVDGASIHLLSERMSLKPLLKMMGSTTTLNCWISTSQPRWNHHEMACFRSGIIRMFRSYETRRW